MSASQRLEHSHAPLADTHVGGVLSEDLLITGKHLVQVAVGLRRGLVIDGA